VGEKVTLTVQEPLAATLPPQLLVWLKLALVAMPVRVSVPLPVLVAGVSYRLWRGCTFTEATRQLADGDGRQGGQAERNSALRYHPARAGHGSIIPPVRRPFLLWGRSSCKFPTCGISVACSITARHAIFGRGGTEVVDSKNRRSATKAVQISRPACYLDGSGPGISISMAAITDSDSRHCHRLSKLEYAESGDRREEETNHVRTNQP
jgi:hypothetical protein